jgi:glycosyltransferase involved in cell wall biosynthesis
MFYPELISTGQTLTELAEELVEKGVKLTVIAAQPTLVPGSSKVPSYIEYRGMTIRRVWSARFRKTSFFGKLANLITFFVSASITVLLEYRHSQLLLLTNPPYLPLLGWLCHRIRRQPFGVVLFDIMPEQAELLHFIRPNGLLARIWRWVNNQWYRKAAYAVVLSSDMLEGALKNANLLRTKHEMAARAKTRIIHVWSDDRMITPRPKPTSREARRLGVVNQFVVQYSGNHGRFHDIETLLALVETFCPTDGFVFQFIGEGQKKKLVEQRIASQGASPLYSSKYVPKELLADSLAMADLGVVSQMPGQERVCYPSKLLGIMAAGRAILAICPPDCEMAHMIREQEIGFVVANGDVIAARQILLEAKANPQLLERMGRNGVDYLREHLTLNKAAEAYYELIAGKSPKPDDRTSQMRPGVQLRHRSDTVKACQAVSSLSSISHE